MNKNFFYSHKIFYIFFCLIFSTSYSYAAPAKKQWVNAPLACLPNRAVKWTIPAEMEPCHCPPQSYCGGTPPEIKPENIKFTVTTGFDMDGKTVAEHDGDLAEIITTSFLGTKVPDIANGKYSIKDILNAQDNQVLHGHNFLRDLLKDIVKAKTGIDMADGLTAQNRITVEIVSSGSINDWIKSIKMPKALIAQCCERSFCPKGMYPETSLTEIPNDYQPRLFRPADLNPIINIMSNYINKYDDLPTATASISATLANILNTAKSRKDAYLANNKSLNKFNDLNQIFQDYVSYIDSNSSDFLPLESMSNAVIALDKIKDMASQLKSEANTRQTPKTPRHAESISCKFDTIVIREGCIREGTQITLADGTKQKIENLKVGDSVKTQNGTAKIMAKSHFTQNTDYMFSINKGRAFFTVEHPILTTDGWKSVDPKITSTKITHLNLKGALKIGDILIREDGKNITVTSIDKVELSDIPQAFNLSLSDKSSFYADGYLMKSFGQMQMHY